MVSTLVYAFCNNVGDSEAFSLRPGLRSAAVVLSAWQAWRSGFRGATRSSSGVASLIDRRSYQLGIGDV
jgi:hypothetical protein